MKISSASAGLLVAVLCSLALATPSHGTSRTIQIKVAATEFKFSLSRTTAVHGPIIFLVVNKGATSHDFKINGRKTPLIPPGGKATLRVTFKKPGRYPYVCTVPGHAESGMKGVLRVT